jgi:hypothetical protein
MKADSAGNIWTSGRGGNIFDAVIRLDPLDDPNHVQLRISHSGRCNAYRSPWIAERRSPTRTARACHDWGRGRPTPARAFLCLVRNGAHGADPAPAFFTWPGSHTPGAGIHHKRPNNSRRLERPQVDTGDPEEGSGSSSRTQVTVGHAALE